MKYFHSISHGKESFFKKLLYFLYSFPHSSSEKWRSVSPQLTERQDETWNCTEHSFPGHVCAQNTKSWCFWSPCRKQTQPSLTCQFSRPCLRPGEWVSWAGSQVWGLGERLRALPLSLPVLKVTVQLLFYAHCPDLRLQNSDRDLPTTAAHTVVCVQSLVFDLCVTTLACISPGAGGSGVLAFQL